MKIYRFYTDENYRGLSLLFPDLVDEKFLNKSCSSDTSVKNEWREIEFKYSDKKKKGDVTDYYYVPIFTDKATEILRPYLENDGEFLPINCKGDKYYIYHLFRREDILDFEKSEFEYYDDNKKTISRIAKFEFKKEKIDSLDDLYMFRLEKPSISNVLFTDKFIELVKKHNLKGFDFNYLVWDSNPEEKEKVDEIKKIELLNGVNYVHEFSEDDINDKLIVENGVTKIKREYFDFVCKEYENMVCEPFYELIFDLNMFSHTRFAEPLNYLINLFYFYTMAYAEGFYFPFDYLDTNELITSAKEVFKGKIGDIIIKASELYKKDGGGANFDKLSQQYYDLLNEIDFEEELSNYLVKNVNLFCTN